MIKYVADQFKLWQYIKRTILLTILPKDTLKALDDFKNKLKSVWRNVFGYVKVYIYSESVFNTLYIEIKTNVKKFPSDKINGTKNDTYLFFFASSNSSQFYF